MLQSNILRTISRSRRPLATATKLPFNAYSSPKNLRSNRRPYHVTQERLYEARKAEPKTNWQRVGNKDCRCKGDCMSVIPFCMVVCATLVVRILLQLPWTDDLIRREEEGRHKDWEEFHGWAGR